MAHLAVILQFWFLSLRSRKHNALFGLEICVCILLGALSEGTLLYLAHICVVIINRDWVWLQGCWAFPSTYANWNLERYSFRHSVSWAIRFGSVHSSLGQITAGVLKLKGSPWSQISSGRTLHLGCKHSYRDQSTSFPLWQVFGFNPAGCLTILFTREIWQQNKFSCRWLAHAAAFTGWDSTSSTCWLNDGFIFYSLSSRCRLFKASKDLKLQELSGGRLF